MLTVSGVMLTSGSLSVLASNIHKVLLRNAQKDFFIFVKNDIIKKHEDKKILLGNEVVSKVVPEKYLELDKKAFELSS